MCNLFNKQTKIRTDQKFDLENELKKMDSNFSYYSIILVLFCFIIYLGIGIFFCFDAILDSEINKSLIFVFLIIVAIIACLIIIKRIHFHVQYFMEMQKRKTQMLVEMKIEQDKEDKESDNIIKKIEDRIQHLSRQVKAERKNTDIKKNIATEFLKALLTFSIDNIEKNPLLHSNNFLKFIVNHKEFLENNETKEYCNQVISKIDQYSDKSQLKANKDRIQKIIDSMKDKTESSGT